MKKILFIFKLTAQCLLILVTWFILYSILSFHFSEITSITPPGAQGISLPFILLVGLSLFLIFGFSWRLQSAAPPIAAAFVMADGLSHIPFIDSRTSLRVSYGYATWGDIYQPVLISGFIVLLLLLFSIFIARRIKHSPHNPSALPKHIRFTLGGFSGKRVGYILATISFGLVPLHFYVSCEMSGLVTAFSSILFLITAILSFFVPPGTRYRFLPLFLTIFAAIINSLCSH